MDKHEVSIDRKQEVIEAITQFKQTRIWEQLLQAEHVLTEAPFTIKITVDDPLFRKITKGKNIQHPLIVTGIIDLAYRYDGRWFIVDYKTDRPREAGAISALSSNYQPQIDLYKEVWGRISGEKVQDAVLYFVTLKEMIFV